jgi:hypothetical protein
MLMLWKLLGVRRFLVLFVARRLWRMYRARTAPSR